MESQKSQTQVTQHSCTHPYKINTTQQRRGDRRTEERGHGDRFGLNRPQVQRCQGSHQKMEGAGMNGPLRSWVGVQSCRQLDFRLLASRTMTQEISLVFIYPEMVIFSSSLRKHYDQQSCLYFFTIPQSFLFSFNQVSVLQLKALSAVAPIALRRKYIEILGRDTKLSGSHQTQLDIMTLFCTNLFCLVPVSLGVLFEGFLSPLAGMEMSDGPPQQLIQMVCEEPHDGWRLNSNWKKHGSTGSHTHSVDNLSARVSNRFKCMGKAGPVFLFRDRKMKSHNILPPNCSSAS